MKHFKQFLQEAKKKSKVEDTDKPEESKEDLDDEEIPDKKEDNKDKDEEELDGDKELDDSDSDDEDVDSEEANDKQGTLRNVKGARLISKRQEEDGTYSELWMYKIHRGIHDESKIRNEILAGTDIPFDETESEDSSQKYELWTIGDAQLCHIRGLQN